MSNTGDTANAGGGSFIGVFMATAIPALIGALLAAGLLFALVYSQTQGPDTNPASKEILVYGD
ncbi:hypothetical protein L2K70_08055 [Nocardioides KLBMP 9356]|uniref:DUF2613 family protein n=1 Tax=Nocardioides potassii TaxID=2911371 RepID=A0ABS9HBR1_9ACTN|nr:hypothetical protein [Nocardioides potassii]MCF6377553.1 hypothetical protein [Nocardioides potassii]